MVSDCFPLGNKRETIKGFALACLLLFLFPKGKQSRASPLHACCCFYCVKTKEAQDCFLCAAKRRILLAPSFVSYARETKILAVVVSYAFKTFGLVAYAFKTFGFNKPSL